MAHNFSTRIINDLGIISLTKMTKDIKKGLLKECVSIHSEWIQSLPKMAPTIVDFLEPRDRDLKYKSTDLLLACAVALAHEAALAELKKNFYDAWNQLEELLPLLEELQRREGKRYKKNNKDSSSGKKQVEKKKNS